MPSVAFDSAVTKPNAAYFSAVVTVAVIDIGSIQLDALLPALKLLRAQFDDDEHKIWKDHQSNRA